MIAFSLKKHFEGIDFNKKKDLNQKSNFYYIRGFAQKRVTNGAFHLHGLAPGQHSFEKTSQQWRLANRWHHCV